MKLALTKREKQILGLVVSGLKNREIAKTICIKESTVESHLHHIYRKLLVVNRAQAIVYALKNGLDLSENINEKI